MQNTEAYSLQSTPYNDPSIDEVWVFLQEGPDLRRVVLFYEAVAHHPLPLGDHRFVDGLTCQQPDEAGLLLLTCVCITFVVDLLSQIDGAGEFLWGK
jgi:hypothetical protein